MHVVARLHTLMKNKASLAYILHDAKVEKAKGDPRTTVPASSSHHRPPCNVPGCARGAVGDGRCIGHGGGRRCAIKECPHAARKGGLCWKHGKLKLYYYATPSLDAPVGGSLRCTMPGCTNGRKSKGVCWKHGGGLWMVWAWWMGNYLVHYIHRKKMQCNGL